MLMDKKILHYFRDINGAYNDCTKYDTLKSWLEAYKDEIMKLNYKTELKHIQKMCRENENCKACPFKIGKNWDYCMFTGPYDYESVVPEDWNLDEVKS